VLLYCLADSGFGSGIRGGSGGRGDLNCHWLLLLWKHHADAVGLFEVELQRVW